MLIVSNHVSRFMEMPKDAVVRVNLAWFKTVADAKTVLDNVKGDVFLDFPRGRTKPPQPSITLNDAIELAKEHKNVRYFAVSNAETPDILQGIKLLLPQRATVVPKIESREGVRNMSAIHEKIHCEFMMLDKEDLYTEVKQDKDEYEKSLALARVPISGVHILELQGVIFS